MSEVYELSTKQLTALETMLEAEDNRVEAVGGPVHYKTAHSLAIRGLIERRTLEVDDEEEIDFFVILDEEAAQEAVRTRQVTVVPE